VARLTVDDANDTWGAYYYILALDQLRRVGLLQAAVDRLTLAKLRVRLDWRTFVDADDFTLIDHPNNYYCVALGIARLRMRMGWEDGAGAHRIYDKIVDHYRQYSGDYGFADETDGEGRFDRYSVLLSAELAHHFVETNDRPPPEVLVWLRKSAEVMLSRLHEDGTGFEYGRSLGPYSETAIIEVLTVAATLPFTTSNFRLFQFTQVLIYAIALLGLNMLTGYNGQISLGHGAFYAIGAYTTAIMIDRWNIGYGWTLPTAGVVCLVVGFLFGRPALRLEGLYLALATFALALSVPQILKYFEHWTGGSQGIVLSKPKPPFRLPLNEDQWLYFLTLAVALVLFVLARNLLGGRVGRAVVAVRDNHIAAEAMGINNSLYKSVVFGVSAAYTGIAGALSAVVIAYVAPDSFDIFLSITLLTGIVIGGLATISGAIFGAVFIQFVPNWAQDISKAAPWAIFGIFLIVFMYVMPRGIAGFCRLVWIRLTRPPVTREEAGETRHHAPPRRDAPPST